MAWTPLPVEAFNFSLVAPVHKSGTKWNASDSLQLSYIGADLSVVEGPVQLGTFDSFSGYYLFDDGSFAATGETGVFLDTPKGYWSTTDPVVGFRISHTNPGNALPFWFSVSVAYCRPFDFADGDEFGMANPSTTPKTPNYEDGTTRWEGANLDSSLYPDAGITTDYYVNYLWAAFAGSPSLPGWLGYPNGVAGSLQSINSTWVSSLAPTVRPWPGGTFTLNSTVPLGDITIIFVRNTSTGPTYLRQRQSPVRSPSRVRPIDLRQRQTPIITR